MWNRPKASAVASGGDGSWAKSADRSPKCASTAASIACTRFGCSGWWAIRCSAQWGCVTNNVLLLLSPRRARSDIFFLEGAGPVVGFLELAGPVVLDERCDIDLARLLDFCASSARRGRSRGPS